MPKAIEECVSKISGNNKRTGKPYTESEKWAICQAAHKNKKDKSEINEFDLELATNRVTNILNTTIRKLMDTNKAKTFEDAYHLSEAMLARAGFDIDVLELIFDK